ncbi:MAG: hypothetical protein JNK11_02155 [Alphaproteobacteria bacterium]|nr:hypothetical protein [Alphaproteobacteria bacterium]
MPRPILAASLAAILAPLLPAPAGAADAPQSWTATSELLGRVGVIEGFARCGDGRYVFLGHDRASDVVALMHLALTDAAGRPAAQLQVLSDRYLPGFGLECSADGAWVMFPSFQPDRTVALTFREIAAGRSVGAGRGVVRLSASPKLKRVLFLPHSGVDPLRAGNGQFGFTRFEEPVRSDIRFAAVAPELATGAHPAAFRNLADVDAALVQQRVLADKGLIEIETLFWIDDDRLVAPLPAPDEDGDARLLLLRFDAGDAVSGRVVTLRAAEGDGRGTASVETFLVRGMVGDRFLVEAYRQGQREMQLCAAGDAKAACEAIEAAELRCLKRRCAPDERQALLAWRARPKGEPCLTRFSDYPAIARERADALCLDASEVLLDALDARTLLVGAWTAPQAFGNPLGAQSYFQAVPADPGALFYMRPTLRTLPFSLQAKGKRSN